MTQMPEGYIEVLRVCAKLLKFHKRVLPERWVLSDLLDVLKRGDFLVLWQGWI
jgi:hypothetical protein